MEMKILHTIIFNNILRLFYVLLEFTFTTSETMRDYNYKPGIYELPHKPQNDLRISIL